MQHQLQVWGDEKNRSFHLIPKFHVDGCGIQKWSGHIPLTALEELLPTTLSYCLDQDFKENIFWSKFLFIYTVHIPALSLTTTLDIRNLRNIAWAKTYFTKSVSWYSTRGDRHINAANVFKGMQGSCKINLGAAMWLLPQSPEGPCKCTALLYYGHLRYGTLMSILFSDLLF